ncbi:MAG: adenosyl-hopene transferase HpnH [Candidatus Omnitrophota bacterium]
MRFPFVLSASLAKYMAKQTLSGRKRFPLVLMLEPTLRCNLDCIGCGRIAEYNANPKQFKDLTVEECLQSVEECGAPIVSVCGGEPLVYKPVDELIRELLARKKYVYLCTNAMFMDRFWERIPPNKRLALSIHLDGMEQGHDWAVARPGTFKKVVEIIEEAKIRGYRICTNTTILKGCNPAEIAEMIEFLHRKGVHGMMISGAYPQEGEKGEACLNRGEMEDVFLKILGNNGTMSKYRFNNTPIYAEFLQGKRDLPCSPWASPNRTPKGWQGPCYVLPEKYYATFAELMESTDWDRLGPGKDPRCANCKIHSGFEPSVALGSSLTLKDRWRMVKWSFFY